MTAGAPNDFLLDTLKTLFAYPEYFYIFRNVF